MKKFNLQMFSGSPTVYPVHNNTFKIGAIPTTGTATYNTIAGMENFSPAIEGTVESWYDMTKEGWQDSVVTGKALSIALSGKRVYGDTGNDAVAALYGATGSAANMAFQWTFANGGKLEFNCAVDVTSIGGGDTTNVDGLEFTVYCKGKPTYTAPAN